MNDITIKQNESIFIQLLKAQRIAYSIAKKCTIIEYAIIVFSMILPLILIYIPDLNKQSQVIITSGILVIASILLDGLLKNRTTIGAKIQEHFDTKLFDIPWNHILCEEQVEHELIIKLAKKYKKHDLENWYSKEIKSELPIEIAILFCQRTNLFWDKDLRKKFTVLAYCALILYYLIVFVLAYFAEIKFDSFLLLFIPTVSFLKFQVQLIRNQYTISNKKEILMSKINSLLISYKKDRHLPTLIEIREIQNAIYYLRTHASKVPDWFYRMFKESYENLTDETIKQKISEIN